MHVVPSQSPPAVGRSARPLHSEQRQASPFMLRLPKVNERTAQSRSTTYLRIHQGLMTRPVLMGPRTVAWPAHEIDAINAAWTAGKTPDEVRALVDRLHAARKAAAEGTAE